jgi:hypothetical protein
VEHLQGKGAGLVVNRLPDFFIVGAPKSGTSSLHSYLSQHPSIFMSEPKEPHFFYSGGLDRPAHDGTSLEEYLALFKGAPEHAWAGEASTSYLYSESAAREIKRLRPDARIMMVLRNPVDRAYSQYWNHVRDGIEPLSFEEALEDETGRVEEGKWHGFHYLRVGKYAAQVERYLETFGEGSVRVYLFEDLTRDAEGVCRGAFAFLDVDPNLPVEVGRVYNRSGPPRSRLASRVLASQSVRGLAGRVLPAALKREIGERLRSSNTKPVPKMDPTTRATLMSVLEEDVSLLEGLIGRDLSHWRR